MTINDLEQLLGSFPQTEKMPVCFFGHGSPMNGIESNPFSDGWAALGSRLPKPRAILSISAHWYTVGTFVHVAERPRTIHDFWGFPEALYDLTYPCPGAPALARSTAALAAPTPVGLDEDWGIDHGTWIVLLRLFPKHEIPVYQLSIDLSKPASYHFDLGKRLAALRRRGVLIMGSGNIVHNLGRVDFSPDAPPYDWAVRFDARVKDLLLAGDDASLIDYEALGEDARLSIPTPDHYLPLLYVLGLREPDDAISFPVEGMSHGSISMRSVLLQ